MMDKKNFDLKRPVIETSQLQSVEIPGQNLMLTASVAIQAKDSYGPDHICQDGFKVLIEHFAAIVLDGVGGTAYGSLSESQKAVQIALAEIGQAMEALPKNVLLSEEMTTMLLALAIQKANLAIFDYNHNLPIYKHVHTTVVASQICQTEQGLAAVIAWVGDSRAYLKGPAGQMTKLTLDDNYIMYACHNDLALAAEWQKKFDDTQMSGEAMQAWFEEFFETFLPAGTEPKDETLVGFRESYETRGWLSARGDLIRLTRSLGEEKLAEIHTKKVLLPPGWSIVLCSDGVSDVLPIQELSQIAAENPNDKFAEAALTAADSAQGETAKNDDRVLVELGLQVKIPVATTEVPE